MNNTKVTGNDQYLNTIDAHIKQLETFLSESYYSRDNSHVAVTGISNAPPELALANRLVRASSADQIEHAWQVYSQALRTLITGGENWPNLQLVAPAAPEAILWDNPTFGPYYFHGVLANLLNATGSTYKKTSNEFAARYVAFLTDVKRTPINEEAESKARGALNEWSQSGAETGEMYLSIRLHWREFDARQRSSLPPSEWISMEEWYELTDSNRVLNGSRQLRDLKYAKFLYWIQQAYGGGETLYRMLKRLEDNRPIEVTLPTLAPGQSGGKTEVYPYQISPDYPDWLNRVRSSSNPLTFTIRHNSAEYNYSKTSISGGVGIGFGFFGIYAGGQRTTVQIDTRQSGFELTFKADIQPFDILPGRWYDSTAFPLFHNGPFFPGSPIDGLYNRGALWGHNGFINYRPARAIVAYKPEVKVKLREYEYHYFRQVTSGATGFFIGPFAIGIGNYYSVQENVRWDDRSFELTLFGGPDTPQLLAFDSEQFE